MRNLKKIVVRSVIAFTIITIVSIIVAAYIETSIESKIEPVDSVKQKAVTYLTAKGYKEKEYQLEVLYRKFYSYGGPYVITVVFNDEPNVRYHYEYLYHDDSKHREITQGGTEPMKGKKDKNFKHAEIK
jgi:hypothetical protein